MNRFPIITITVIACATAVHFSAGAASALVYDRSEILSGELWRVMTCNFVHFSKSHFGYDLIAFALAGSLIESRRTRGFAAFCLLSPLMIGIAVLLLQPDLEVSGGLSGMATGAIVFLSLCGLHEHGLWRWICLLALLAIAMKITFEFATGQLLFAQSDALFIKPVPVSHVAGAVTAAAVIIARNLSASRPSQSHCVALR